METSTIEIRHRKTTKGENYKTPSYLRNAVKKYEEQNITPEKRQAKLAYLKVYYDENKEKISDYHKKYYEKNKSKNITENKTETTHNKPINPKTKEPYKTPEYIRQAIKNTKIK